MRGISRPYFPVWNRFCHDASGSYHGLLANRNALQYDAAHSYERAALNQNRGTFCMPAVQLRVKPLLHVERVCVVVADYAAGSDGDLVFNDDLLPCVNHDVAHADPVANFEDGSLLHGNPCRAFAAGRVEFHAGIYGDVITDSQDSHVGHVNPAVYPEILPDDGIPAVQLRLVLRLP